MSPAQELLPGCCSSSGKVGVASVPAGAGATEKVLRPHAAAEAAPQGQPPSQGGFGEAALR